MKKLLSSISVLMVALFALVSCEQTSYLYEPTNECLTFSANSGAWLFTDEPVIEFQLVRGVLSSDLTVNLTLSGDGLFSLETPAAVHFASGGAGRSGGGLSLHCVFRQGDGFPGRLE